MFKELELSKKGKNYDFQEKSRLEKIVFLNFFMN